MCLKVKAEGISTVTVAKSCRKRIPDFQRWDISEAASVKCTVIGSNGEQVGIR